MRHLVILALMLCGSAALAQPLSADRLREDVRTLASDEFLGRGPGEAGEARTIAFLADSMARIGLAPAGENGGWLQDVPLVRLDRQQGASLTLSLNGRQQRLELGKNATFALRNDGHSVFTDLPLVFAGFGIVDPVRGWDAYQGVDMMGKVAVLLCNDPDFEAGRDLGFEGRRMAYEGRVGVKIEAAIRAGAVGVLIIHEEPAASYPFSQLGSGDALPAFVFQPMKPSKLKFVSWLAEDAWQNMLKASGLRLDKLKRRARDPHFRAFAVHHALISGEGELKASVFVSHNVVGKIIGATRPDDVVIYGAHWDANGRNGPDAKGDDIRNGAIDNATGTAELLEIARAFKDGKAPERSVIFAAWTAEEKGLMGSDWYASHPLFPLAHIVANLNLDPHVMLPAARDIELIGGGRSAALESAFARAAAAQGLRVDAESSPEAGWYFRSDHFSFARRGVPALAFRAGRDLIDGGRERGQPIVAAYNRNCYHQPCDEFDPGWDFAGATQEASVAYALGRELADSADWPDWDEGVAFKALREQSEAERR